MFAMVVSGRDKDNGVAYAGLGEFIDGAEDRDVTADFSEKGFGAIGVEVSDGDEFACIGVASEFVNVEGVNNAHAAESGDGEF
jgi:hypothetical protein